jgi:hypothetical protein
MCFCITGAVGKFSCDDLDERCAELTNGGDAIYHFTTGPLGGMSCTKAQ